MEYLPIMMVRPTLDGIPEHPLPDGYSIRPYVDGDKQAWVSLWQAAEPFLTITPETFDVEFGEDLPAMEKRCLFLVAPDGGDVGTATAWYTRKYQGKAWGRVHWVAILPAYQGRGLAKPLMSAVLKRMRALGHRRAVLQTQTPRLAAIRTYLDFGFRPDMTAENAEHAWDVVRSALKHEALATA
ncbi:MAG: GNAT family N-acetyltransferase [Planctomycetes bacterium]|nr:GNAT family N-acetyltransferase [Planctomycetota bacterium]